MILLKSLNVNVLCERRSIVLFFINFKLLLVLCTIQISLSYPMESLVYETNPVQKLSFQYNQDGSTRPIRFKLQTIAFKINEQLPSLDVYHDSMQESGKNARLLKNENKLNKKEELRELAKKFHPLSRFTVFYNTPERDLVNNNEANKDTQQVNSTTENQTEPEGLKLNSDNNTNTKLSKTANREKYLESLKEINTASEDETTESKRELSANMHEIEMNKEKINSLLGTIKNEYDIVTEGVSVQDVTEPVITTETMLETANTESYEYVDKEANVIIPKENNESDYKSTYKINNNKDFGRHQTAESITIEDLQTDIYDNDNITTEGYSRTDEYEESGNITDAEKPHNK